MKVQVKNCDHREYREIYRDEEIVIPAGKSVEMGRADAVTFLGQFVPMVVDGSGRCIKPKNLKIIEDPEKHAEKRGQPLKYSAPDGKEFRTESGLGLYMKKLAGELTPEEKRIVQDEPRRRNKVGNAKA